MTFDHHPSLDNRAFVNFLMKKTRNLSLTAKQAEFLHNAVCGVPDDQRKDGDERFVEYLLTELDSILISLDR